MMQLLIVAAVAFLVVICVTPTTMRILREKGIIGVDVHKPSKPEIPREGGVVILFAMIVSLLFILGTETFVGSGRVSLNLLAALVAILMAGMVGLLDDFLDFKNRTKIVLPLVASAPLAALQVGVTSMDLPVLGRIELGLVYPLLVVPLMVTFIIDSTNMYAGMNGLESGLALINSSAIIAYLVLRTTTGLPLTQAQLDAGLIAAAVAGATAAFLFYNHFPARVLSSDVGLLAIGAAIASSLVIGNMDRLAIFLYFTFGINFLMYIVYRLGHRPGTDRYAKFASPREDGTLEVVGPYTMYWLIPYLHRSTTESINVILLLLLQAVIAYGAVYILVFGVPFVR
ncbi:MAG: hypothetical protein QXQ81_09725 [Candidatus Thorarchaeota archaeon]